MKITKEVRTKVWLKYEGRCAYCGKDILYRELRVDHLKPRLGGDAEKEIVECFENYMPSCRRCNHYKGGYSLNEFRHQMRILDTRLKEIFKCKVALDYKIITIQQFDGSFYFERYARSTGTNVVRAEQGPHKFSAKTLDRIRTSAEHCLITFTRAELHVLERLTAGTDLDWCQRLNAKFEKALGIKPVSEKDGK